MTWVLLVCGSFSSFQNKTWFRKASWVFLSDQWQDWHSALFWLLGRLFRLWAVQIKTMLPVCFLLRISYFLSMEPSAWAYILIFQLQLGRASFLLWIPKPQRPDGIMSWTIPTRMERDSLKYNSIFILEASPPKRCSWEWGWGGSASWEGKVFKYL